MTGRKSGGGASLLLFSPLVCCSGSIVYWHAGQWSAHLRTGSTWVGRMSSTSCGSCESPEQVIVLVPAHLGLDLDKGCKTSLLFVLAGIVIM